MSAERALTPKVTRNILACLTQMEKGGASQYKEIMKIMAEDLTKVLVNCDAEIEAATGLFKYNMGTANFVVTDDGVGSFPTLTTNAHWKTAGSKLLDIKESIEIFHDELLALLGTDAKRAKSVADPDFEKEEEDGEHPLRDAGLSPAKVRKEAEREGVTKGLLEDRAAPPREPAQGIFDLNRKIVVPPDWAEISFQSLGEGLGFKQQKTGRLTRAQWSTANMNVLISLDEGMQKPYVRYLTNLFELADRYEWTTVHDFDAQNRANVKSGHSPTLDSPDLLARFAIMYGSLATHSKKAKDETKPRSPPQADPKPCNFFNKPTGCDRPDCTFIHKCSRCNSRSHCILDCPQPSRSAGRIPRR